MFKTTKENQILF